MEEFNLWEVEMAISGSISIKKAVQISVLKGYKHPFLSTVRIKPTNYGVNLQVEVKATNQDKAGQSALFFVGEMLNLLSLRLKELPLYLSLADAEIRSYAKSRRRLIDRDEWAEMFRQGYEYGQQRPLFNRALSWYRKGLISDDPLDKLLAIWLSMEVICKECGTDTHQTDSEIQNKMMSCFNVLWPNDDSHWHGQEWLTSIRQKRNQIAHGRFRVNSSAVLDIAYEMPSVQELAYRFLVAWEQRGNDNHI